MNINRHNYEEFFLLYVDNELTTAQRKIVEFFVAANPDLKQEFELIQQTTLKNDERLDSAFITTLLKTEEQTVSEEQLLLYVDDELNAEENYFVETELSINSELQTEVNWLKRAKFAADETIQFPDKSLLYKQEQPAKIISITTVAQRWAAAAAIIVLLAGAYWLMQTKPAQEQPERIAQLPSTIEQKLNKKNAATDVAVKTAVTAEPEVKENNISAGSLVAEINLPKNKIKHAVVTSPEKNETGNETTQLPIVETASISNLTTDPQKKYTEAGNTIITSNVPQQTNTISNVTYASYNEDEDADEEGVFLTEERQRKSGLKAFVKKAKRMIERKTGMQSTDSEVRFAVFAVNTQ